jgi:hypothetical protein
MSEEERSLEGGHSSTVKLKEPIKGPDDTLQEFRQNASKAVMAADDADKSVWPDWFKKWVASIRA